MSATAEPPLPQPRIDINEEARMWGWSGSAWVELSVDATGQLQTALSDALQSEATDELRVRAFGPDAGGTLQQVNAEQFDTALGATDAGLATWGDRALRTLAQDHVQTVVHGLDQAGSLQEAGVEAFNSAAAAGGFALLTYGDRALQTQARDERRIRVFGLDAGSALQQVNAEQFDTVLAATDAGLATYGDRALQSLAQDELRSRVHDSAGTQIDPATTALEDALQANAADEFRSRIHDSTGAQLDPLNQDALQSVANDELRARLFQPDAGGVLQQVIAEQLDTAVGATDVGVLTWVARALNSIGADELVSRTADSTGAQQDLKQAAEAFENGTAIAAGATVENLLRARGAEAIEGRVVVDQTYDVDIEWQDDAGNVLFTRSVASGVAGGTETQLSVTVVESSNANVVVTNTSANAGTTTQTLHMG